MKCPHCNVPREFAAAEYKKPSKASLLGVIARMEVEAVANGDFAQLCDGTLPDSDTSTLYRAARELYAMKLAAYRAAREVG